MKLADTQAIAILTRRSPSTIRRWAHEGRLKRRGTGPRGRALYSIDDAEQLAAQMNLTTSPDLREHSDNSAGSVS